MCMYPAQHRLCTANLLGAEYNNNVYRTTITKKERNAKAERIDYARRLERIYKDHRMPSGKGSKV